MAGMLGSDEKRAINLAAEIGNAMEEVQQIVDRAIYAITGMPTCQEHQALIEVANYIVSCEI